MARITEDFVSYEVAKLLKEKGFDELCKYWYEDDGERYTLVSTCYQNVCDEGECLCPTHQMAMKWLREKQGIIITVDYNEDEDCEKNERFGFTIYQKDTRKVDLAIYPTYEEAVEAALKYSLENLI